MSVVADFFFSSECQEFKGRMGMILWLQKRLPFLKTKNVLRKSRIRVYLGPKSQSQLADILVQ